MCGIVGYVGHQEAQPILLNGLSKLEYRGYDSAGLATFSEDGLIVRKTKGRLSVLADSLSVHNMKGSIGIGHTRWATHGKPSDVNSHPHTDNAMKFSVVHNGIIENYLELKEELQAKGHVFVSETDTEVVSHLLAELYEGSVLEAVKAAVAQMRGAFALGVLSDFEPDQLIAVRYQSPLILGLGDGENFIASDIPAILEHTRDIYILNDGEMAVLTRNGIQLLGSEGEKIDREIYRVEWDLVQAEKAGYEHFMLKEIFEQPKAYTDTMRGRIDEETMRVIFNELEWTAELANSFDRIHIVACGTAYHAGMVGKTVLEQLLRIPVETDIASEYRYRKPIITPQTLLIVVSQSGETADTLAALREAKKHGARVLAITNVVGSSVSREADNVIITWAGPEIAVASTKAYTSQLVAFYLFSLYMAQLKEVIVQEELTTTLKALIELPAQVQHILHQHERIKRFADRVSEQPSVFFMGRGLDYAVALEGSLKLKEISYIHSEAYAAGELKHGTLALIEEGRPVIALATQPALFEKTVSNIKEVKARGAYVLGVTWEGDEELIKSVDKVFKVPQTIPLLTSALTVIPLQLLAYYTSVARGNDVDKPRNLAKSVTVE